MNLRGTLSRDLSILEGSHKATPLRSVTSVHSRNSAAVKTTEEKRYSKLDKKRERSLSMRESIITEVPEEVLTRARKNCLFGICYKIASHPLFTVVITLLIFLNTGVLAADKYPENSDYVH